MKAFLESFAAILGTLTLSVLLMSISHEYGYFLMMGRHFQTLLATTDYLANGVVWLPLALVIAYGTVDIGKRKQEVKKQERDWKNWRTWIWPILVGIAFVISVIITRWPPFALSLYYWMGVVIFVWVRIWKAFVPSALENNTDDLATVIKETVRLVPPFLIALFLLGAADASQDLETVDDPYIFHFKGSDHPQLRIFLRSFDKGVLVRNVASNRIEFHKWIDVEMLEKQPHGKTESLLCWMGYCPGKPDEPTP
jgi:hypothetical protein